MRYTFTGTIGPVDSHEVFLMVWSWLAFSIGTIIGLILLVIVLALRDIGQYSEYDDNWPIH